MNMERGCVQRTSRSGGLTAWRVGKFQPGLNEVHRCAWPAAQARSGSVRRNLSLAFITCMAVMFGFETARAAEAESVVQARAGATLVTLHLGSKEDPSSAGQISIEAFGERLVSGKSSNGIPGIRIGGKAPAAVAEESDARVAQAQGDDWRLLEADLSRFFPHAERVSRRVLLIEDNLVVVLDDVLLKAPGTIDLVFATAGAAQLDPEWEHWTAQSAEGGMIVRSLSRSQSEVGVWKPAEGRIHLGTQQFSERIRLLTAIVLYPGQEVPSVTFKYLESVTAAGARIHRNGLPTLAAFRLDDALERANLAGMPFTGPAGVSIFRPRKR